MKKRLFLRIFPAIFAVIFAALAVSGLLIDRAVRYYFYQRTALDLQTKTALSLEIARRFYEEENFTSLDSLARKLGEESYARVTFFAPDAKVWGDSDVDPALMESHSDRPEVIAALNGQTRVSLRFSTTLKQKLLYVSMPVSGGGGILGVIRTAYSLHSINETVRRCDAAIALILSVTGICAVGALWFISASIKNSLLQLKHHTALFLQGKFEKQYYSPRFSEIAELAAALDEAAGHLSECLDSQSSQRTLLEDIFNTLPEGALVIDRELRIVRFNPAAARMLELPPRKGIAFSVQEAVLDAGLQRFISEILCADSPREEEIAVLQGKTIFRVVGIPLKIQIAAENGALIVFNDITQLKKLETVRQDFAANVSHELKTPVTAIKGFAETLSDSPDYPAEVRRFADIIGKHAGRLNSIIDDLMLLAKMEAENQTDFPLVSDSLSAALQSAAERCKVLASAKNLSIIIECEGNITVRMNQPLVEQAVVNLLENAVKFSPQGGTVTISGKLEEGKAVIAVSDQGTGIEPEHQARIFERFYRIDKNRSRKEGGSGLGLAIVKHIALAHKGEVAVNSIPGKGSEFRVSLPVKKS